MSAPRRSELPPAAGTRAVAELLRARGGAIAAGAVLAGLLLAAVSAVQVLVLGIPLHVAELAVSVVLALSVGGLAGSLVVTRQQMRRERDLYHALADLSLEFATFQRLQGGFEYVSPAVQSLTGYTQEDFYLRPELMERISRPAGRARSSCA